MHVLHTHMHIHSKYFNYISGDMTELQEIKKKTGIKSHVPKGILKKYGIIIYSPNITILIHNLFTICAKIAKGFPLNL